MAYNSSFCLVGMPESISLYPVPASSMMESIVSRSFPALGMQLGENRLAWIGDYPRSRYILLPNV